MKKFSFHCKSDLLFLLADEDTTLNPNSLSVEVEEDLPLLAGKRSVHDLMNKCFVALVSLGDVHRAERIAFNQAGAAAVTAARDDDCFLAGLAVQ